MRRCRGAQLDPNFERGATRLQNVMKAAVCLLDIELSQLSSAIRSAYRADPHGLGIFAVAASHGGPRHVAKLYRALDRMGIQTRRIAPRRRAHTGLVSRLSLCLARGKSSVVRAVSIPRYNRENAGYIEKYQSALSLID